MRMFVLEKTKARGGGSDVKERMVVIFHCWAISTTGQNLGSRLEIIREQISTEQECPPTTPIRVFRSGFLLMWWAYLPWESSIIV